MQKTFLTILILTILFIPLFASADLEYHYPELPGTAQKITKDSSLGDVVKYFASWAIIIGAVIAFFALMYAGFRYLTSAGNPGAMRDAQAKVLNSFLGLLILLGSYIILITVNPQLMLMKIEKKPIVSGVVLFFSDDPQTNGGTRLSSSGSLKETKQIVEQLVKEGKAVYLKADSANNHEMGLFGGKTFGDFIVPNGQDPQNPNNVFFENFKKGVNLTLGFFEGTNNIKVIAYNNLDFKNNDGGEEYSYYGRIDRTTGEIAVADPAYLAYPRAPGLNFVDLESEKSEVDFITKTENEWKNLKEDEKDLARKNNKKQASTKHPPLSFEVKTIVPDVYVYSDKIGEEKHFLAGAKEDFTKSTKYLNDNIKYIELKNQGKDYLAVLHENDGYSGQIKFFFQKKQRKILKKPATGDVEIREEEIGNYEYNSLGGLFQSRRSIIGSPNPDPPYPFGKIKDPSAISVFNLSDDPSVCRKVSICTGSHYGLGGGCIVYLNKDEQLNEEDKQKDTAYKTELLPFYKPINIPDTKLTLEYTSSDGGTLSRDVRFAKNIRSIKIEGNCLVALFENKVDHDKWKTGTPGESQIFYEDNDNLSDEEIGRCGGQRVIGLWVNPKPCASSIAVFPIAPLFGGGSQ